MMDVVAHMRDWPWHFPMTEPVLVGVSGGVDSMVLVGALVRAGWTGVVVVHVNHQLRGEAAEADEELVRNWAGRHGCGFEVVRAGVAARAAGRGISLETAGREVRLEFFREVAARRRVNRLLLAHHADDLVETLLMHLLRGAGTHGLGGMRAVTAWSGLEIIRPLLGVWRRDIEEWARQQNIPWREDESNHCPEHFRNRLRHEALPALERALGREVRQGLWRTAVLAAEDDAELAAAAGGCRAAVASADGSSLVVARLRELSPALARRVVHDWLRAAGISEVGFELVERVLAVVRSTGRPASCNMTGGWRVRRRAGVLFMDSQAGRAASGREPSPRKGPEKG